MGDLFSHNQIENKFIIQNKNGSFKNFKKYYIISNT